MKLDTETLIEDLADSAVDGIDMKDLIRFYRDYQNEWLTSLTEEELLEHAKDFLHNFDKKDYTTGDTHG